MTRGQARSKGFLPPALPRVGRMDRAVLGLSRARPAGTGAFMIEGAEATVRGDQRRSGSDVFFHGVGGVLDFLLDAGPAANLLIFPGLARRELVGPPGSLVESMLVAPSLPLAVVQWDGQLPDKGALTFRMRLDHHHPTGELEASDAGVALVAGGQGLVALFDPPPRSIRTSWVDDRRREVSVSVVPDTDADPPLTVALAGGGKARVRASAGAVQHLRGHLIRAAAGPLDDGLTLVTGVPEIDEGLTWARIRVRRSLERLAAGLVPQTAAGIATVDPSSSLSLRTAAVELGLAALAGGDRSGAQSALGIGLLDRTPEEGVLAGRFASTFGDSAPAASVAHHWLERGDIRNLEDAALEPIAREALADGLLYAASEDTRAALRRGPEAGARSRGAVSGGANRTPGQVRHLPVVGAAATGHPARVERLRRLLTAPAPGPADETWISWRTRLEEGLRGGAAGPATWDTATDPADALEAMAAAEAMGPAGALGAAEAMGAAEIVLTLAAGILGAVADAPAGRMRLAPRLPTHLARLEVHGIPLGEGEMELEFEREDTTLRYHLRPGTVSVPPTVVFEPTVQGHIEEVRVDGARAELATREEWGATVAPVQLALDAPRTIEIETRPDP